MTLTNVASPPHPTPPNLPPLPSSQLTTITTTSNFPRQNSTPAGYYFLTALADTPHRMLVFGIQWSSMPGHSLNQSWLTVKCTSRNKINSNFNCAKINSFLRNCACPCHRPWDFGSVKIRSLISGKRLTSVHVPSIAGPVWRQGHLIADKRSLFCMILAIWKSWSVWLTRLILTDCN